MTRKGAMLMVGFFKNYKQCLPSIVENVIKFNDLDVYMYMKEDSASTTRRFQSLPDNEHIESNVRGMIGDNLVHFSYTKDDDLYETMKDQFYDVIQRRFIDFTERRFGKEGVENYNMTKKGFLIDQFIRLSHGTYRMKKYVDKHKLKYDYIIRFRPDFLVNTPLPLKNWPKLEEKEVYFIEMSPPYGLRDTHIARHDDFFSLTYDFLFEYYGCTHHTDGPLEQPEIQWANSALLHNFTIMNAFMEITSPNSDFLEIIPTEVTVKKKMDMKLFSEKLAASVAESTPKTIEIEIENDGLNEVYFVIIAIVSFLVGASLSYIAFKYLYFKNGIHAKIPTKLVN
jgi:hypothetical protein